MCTETEGKRERFEEFNYLTEACYWCAPESCAKRIPECQRREARHVPRRPMGHWGPHRGPQGTGAPQGGDLGEAGGQAKVGRAGAAQGQRHQHGDRAGSVRDSFAPRLGWRGRGSLAREVQMDSVGVQCVLQTPLCSAELQAAESGSGPDPAQRGPAHCGAHGC